MNKELKRLVVLDTHAILHRAYHALPDLSSSKGEPTGALYGIISMLLKIATDLRPDYIVAAHDLPGPTYRHAAYEDYKATRAKAEGDLVQQITRARDVLRALGIPGYEAPGFEADDIIGTIVEQTKHNSELEVIIASGDMDALQLVDGTRVRVFTLKKGLSDTVLYDEDGVRARFGFGPAAIPDLKGIAGDSSDNIKGVPGVGEGSALKLLGIFGTIEKLYAAIKKEGVEAVAAAAGVQKRFVQLVADNKESAEFSKELATIRRDAPVTFALPGEEWRASVDSKELLAMLNEFEFRSLIPRAKAVFNGAQADDAAGPPDTPPAEDIDEEELRCARIAVSVLDSNIAEPEMEDILRMGKSQKFAEAYAHLRARIDEEELEYVYKEIELPLSPVLRRMEARGILVDKEFLRRLSADYSAELKKIAERIYRHAGGEFNVSSPKQLGEVLFDKLGLAAKKKTAGGARSTRETELLKLKDQHPIIEEILAYRELSKLLSTYIDAIPEQLDGENRLHTRYVQIGAATGRMASKDPNLQNIPIKSDLGRRIRHAFVPSPGMSLLSFDYSQIELRVAALLSRDEGLEETFKNGRDIHTEVATRVFGVKAADVTYEQRRRAKVINFGILYGMGVNALQQSLGTTRREAQEFYDQYFAAFPRLAAFLESVVADAARRGYTKTFFGRRRYFEGIHSPIPYVKAAAERMALNAPFQGTAADMLKLAMVRIDRYLESSGRTGHLLLQVHDELVFEVEEAHVSDCAREVKDIMEHVLSKEESRGIPFIAEGKVGKSWGDMEKL